MDLQTKQKHQIINRFALVFTNTANFTFFSGFYIHRMYLQSLNKLTQKNNICGKFTNPQCKGDLSIGEIYLIYCLIWSETSSICM